MTSIRVQYTMTILRRASSAITITGVEVALVGATIYAFIRSPYLQAVGFGAYVLISALVLLRYVVGMVTWQTNLDDIHTLLAETNAKVEELSDYVKRNDGTL